MPSLVEFRIGRWKTGIELVNIIEQIHGGSPFPIVLRGEGRPFLVQMSFLHIADQDEVALGPGATDIEDTPVLRHRLQAMSVRQEISQRAIRLFVSEFGHFELPNRDLSLRGIPDPRPCLAGYVCA